MIRSESDLSQSGVAAALPVDRRQSQRAEALGHVWLAGLDDSSAVPCRCIDVSDSGIRLRAPLGYGIREGREYELCSHPPEAAGALLGLVVRRRARVVRSSVHLGNEGDTLDLGIAFLPRDWTQIGSV